jgi:SWI/SNF-related matrix-associated actin-dependent regulator of chromatin subfamily A-like protein 1
MTTLSLYALRGIPYVRAASSLGDRFQLYLDSLGPTSRYDKIERAMHVPVEDGPSIEARLRGEGFRLNIDPTWVDLQSAYAAGKAFHQETTRARLSRLAIYPYQEAGVAWLTEHRSGLLADEMGTGKTVMTLTALPAGSACLVVCPAVAMGSWMAEIRKWRPDLQPVRLSKQSFAIPKPPFVGLVSYDSLPFDARPAAGLTLVADEAHYLKSTSAQRTQNFRLLAGRTLQATGRVWLLTGTPVLNRPPELWAILHAAGLAYRAFGSWERFVELFHGRPNGPKGKWGTKWGSAAPEVRGLLKSVMLRRTRAEVLPDLPEKTYGVLSADVSKTILKQLDKLESLIGSSERLLEKLEEDVTFEKISEIFEKLSTAKIPSLLEHVERYEESETPLVVFSAHRRPVEALKSRPGWTTILGDDSADARASKVAGFQSGKYRGIAGTIQALGTSVTLTRACNVLFVSRRWTPAENQQAEDRCARIGQRSAVLVYDLVSSHPLDGRIAKILGAKTSLIDSVL